MVEAQKTNITTPTQENNNTRFQIFTIVYNRIKEQTSTLLQEQKPWGELIDQSSFSRPNNTSEALNRFRQNLNYFRVNYLIIIVVTLIICMALNPGALLILTMIFALWAYCFIIRSSPFVIAGRTISEREKLIALSAFSFIIIFFMTSIGTLLFSAVLVGICVIALHGALRVPDDLFIDESQTQPSIWSILTGENKGPAQISQIV